VQPKSSTSRCSGSVTERNCGAAMCRGEQQEVNQRPARKKLDSATDIGEPAKHGRSLNLRAQAETRGPQRPRRS